jgi:hypothetical protein
MRTFLVKDKKPICSWGNLRNNTFFEGVVPDGYKLAINPTYGIIVIDVDVDLDKEPFKNGFDNIPIEILKELGTTYNYYTKRGGAHFWFKYTGDKELPNKASNLSIDLRVGYTKNNNGGYAIYYPANQGDDIRNHLHKIKETSPELNKWIEEVFYYVN